MRPSARVRRRRAPMSPEYCSLLVSLTVLVGCGATGSSGPPAPSDPLPALQAVPDAIAGGRIVDDSGREVLLRGVNVNAFVERCLSRRGRGGDRHAS